ncbi:MAG TPA: DUF262 domain-containing protein [Candidatus Dormibacteraeota bacterium]|nr:DUF262 domain-containing protein [Candidatus Dormibacteraeota bacterium]
MGLEQARVSEIVDRAVTHRWSIPEFQRGFVWTPQKVRDLADSMWRGYPIGSFLIWYSPKPVEPQTAQDASEPAAWVVDGQQRTTALCLLMGRKPYFFGDDWNGMLERHDVRFDVLAEEDPYFSLRSAAMKGVSGRRWVSVREILTADDERLTTLINDIIDAYGMPPAKFGLLWQRLSKVRQIREEMVPVVSVSLDLEDVTEIFSRLNGAGTKVTEADIALALAASQNPGWVRREFLPFVERLREAGFELDPNMVFRSALAIGLGRARFRDWPEHYWKTGVVTTWPRVTAAWQRTIAFLEQHGVLSADLLPTKNALIPLATMADRFSDAFASGACFAWLLHATRAARYSGAAVTALDADVRTIREATSVEEALPTLRSRLGPWEPFTPSDFLVDFRDRFLRLLLYLVLYSRGARDWGESRQRLGFRGEELFRDFKPQWHHIYPRAFLRDRGVPPDTWDLFANIAVLAPDTNLRFSSKAPTIYLETNGVDDAMLAEQLVPPASTLVVERYQEFLRERASRLAEAANAYMAALGGEVDA